MASAMDVDEEEVEMASSSSGKGDKKRFEVKKVTTNYALSSLCSSTVSSVRPIFAIFSLISFSLQWNAVALWAWG